MGKRQQREKKCESQGSACLMAAGPGESGEHHRGEPGERRKNGQLNRRGSSKVEGRGSG